MADKLIFPIGFDLESAVKKAQGDADRLLRQLETTIRSRPLAINLKINNAADGSIDAINNRMKELVKQWNSLTEAQRISNKTSGEFTPEAKKILAEYTRLTGAAESYARTLQQIAAAARKSANEQEKNLAKQRKTTAMLKAQENSIAAVTAKLQYYKKEMNSSAVGGAQFNKAANEVKRLTERLKTLQTAVNSATGASKKQAEAVKQTTDEFQKQDGYVSRLLKRLAVYATFSSITNLLTSVREITAQFELQRVSLGAILQDQAKANQLFGQIKSFALKSPVSIMDLTKYTKQVAAYGIEADKLFETTKMLTDVSVGLGTDVGRLTLAFGQIRSASVLKASELRQLTEAGIPALDLLAKQLTETNGRLVTTAEVMDLISKRAISFEMVEQMFKDLTSAGGMFYDMQEKQGNTLFGLWAKLGDAASIMYDEIGNTSGVNSGMKDLIRNLSDLMRNWRNVGLIIGETVAAFALYKLTTANAALVTNALTAAEVRELAVKKVHYKTQPLIIRGIIGETNARKLSIMTVRAHAAAVRASATATNVFTKAWYSLKAAFLANPFGIVLTALTALVTYLIFADDKVKRFQEDLANIKAEGFAEATKSAYNFEQLADKAVKAADGSKEQKDALDELHRTYKDMIPIQDLTIEKLRDLKGNYDSLTQSIREYVYQRNLQQQIDAIITERTGTMTRIEQKLRDELKSGVKYQTSDAVHTKDLGIDDNQISALFSRIKTEAKNTTKDVQTIIKESVDEIFGYMSQEDRNLLYYMGYTKGDDLSFMGDGGVTDGWLTTLQSIIELQRKMDGEIDNATASMSAYVGNLGKYKDTLDGITEKVQKYRLVTAKGDGVERNTYIFQQGQNNFQIKEWAQSMKTELEQAGVTVQEGIFNLVQKINENDPTKISTIDFNKLLPLLDTPEVKERLGNSYETFKNYVLSIQKSYEGIVPSDPIVQAIRSKMLSLGNATQVGMDKMKKYLWDGKGDIKDHLKTLKESAKGLEDEIYKYSNYIKLFGTAGKMALKFMGIDVDALTEEYDALTKQIQYVQTYVKETDKSKGGASADARLQTLQEIANKMAEVNKEYDELLKKEGQTKALTDTQKLFASSFEQMSKTAKKYGFKLPAFEVPQTIEDVQKWYTAMQKEIKRLGLKNADKVLIELGFKSDKAAIDKQQKDIEKQLKDLADRISRTKTAREFYEKILKSTRDVNIAENMTLSVFGIDGSGLAKQTADQVRTLAESIGKELPKGIINLDEAINPTKLREWADELAKIEGATEVADKLKKIADDEEKVDSKRHELWAKDLEKAKEYADKRIELAQYTADQIAEIEAKQRMLDPNDANYKAQMAVYDEMIRGYREREKNEAAKLDYEQVKEQIGMFDDLGVRIGTAFEQILADLKAYTQSPDFARLGLEAQKNVYSQIAKIEDRMAEGFQGIGIGTVSEYVREYSTAASEYLTAQRGLKEATLAAIDADKKYNEAKKSGNQAAIDAALAEKQLADSRVATATAAVNTAGANLQRTQSNAARASEKFNSNLQKVESSLKSLNNGALRALWNLMGDKGKRTVGEFLSGSYKMVDAIEKLSKALADSDSDMGKLSKSIVDNLATALSSIDPEDSEAIAKAATESLKQTLSTVINDKGVVELLSSTLSKNIGEIASQALSGVLSTEDAVNKVGALIDGIADAASATGDMWGAIISLVLSLLDEFAENGIGTFLGELLDNIGEAVEGILANLLTESLPKIIGSVGNVVKGVGVGLADMLTFGMFDLTGQKRVKRANKEIDRQQELLDQLEYTYGRLEKAAEKAFGGDYVSNFKQQKKVLQAEAEAYRKQMEAEESKGKKADEEKRKGYEEKWRETMDEIADMEGQLLEHFSGMSKTDFARQIANSWIEARSSMSDTFAAIKGDYKDMLKSMLVETMAAKIAENAFTGLWDDVDKKLEANDVDGAVDAYVSGMDAALRNANDGLETWWRAMEARGYDMNKLLGDTDSGLTGIAKQVAGASSEEILANTNALNTQNYYMAQINANVALIAAGMGAGGNTPALPSTDYTPLIQQSLENQGMMIRYQAETVTECREIAARCKEQTELMRRVIVSRQSGTSGYVVATKLM